jgi:hypothetical protein
MTVPMPPDELRALLDQAADGPTNATFDAVYAKAHRSRRVRTIGAVVGVVVVAAAAVTIPVAVAQQHNAAAPGPVHKINLPAQVVHENPLKLVNVWAVRAPGVHNTTLRIDHHLEVTQPCGTLAGNWSADRSGDFVAGLAAGHRPCFVHGYGPNIPWLDAATSFRVYGDEIRIQTKRPQPGGPIPTGTSVKSCRRRRPCLEESRQRPLPQSSDGGVQTSRRHPPTLTCRFQPTARSQVATGAMVRVVATKSARMAS